MKKPTPKLNFIVPLIIYPFDVMISLGQTDEELFAVLKRKGLAEEDETLWKLNGKTGIGRTCQFSTGGTLLRLKNFPDTSFDYGALNHEIFHAVTYVMHQVGMPLEIGVSDEAYAYLIGYLTEEIMRKIGVILRKK